MLIDLHIHTTASDGVLSPKEIVAFAHEQGLLAIAITDHDTTDGLDEGLREGKRKKIDVIPGLELSTDFKTREVHLLGYYIEYQNEFFQRKLSTLRDNRVKRAKSIVAKLNYLGFKLDWEHILAIARGGSVGRPHIAQALMEKSYISSIEEGFNKLLVKGAPAYVPREKISIAEGIALIKEAKGIPVLAHPGLLNDRSLVQELLGLGIEGLEAYYPLHSQKETTYCLQLCSKYGLIATGGSDYHGRGNEFRCKIGAVEAPYTIIKELKNKVNKSGFHKIAP
ncbi:PHP domain-containing protein [Bacillota bacterium LX-D]|nr:PHP domain-containing protein [Bacillota bacterium LX-D]